MFVCHAGDNHMKGRITCPACGQQFIKETTQQTPTLSVHCPHCNHHFVVKIPSQQANDKEQCMMDDDSVDCTWEEYGEPRKTILSSTKRRTDKPKIAAFLLFIVVIMGLGSAVIPDTFIDGSLDLLAVAGVSSQITIEILNQTGVPQEGYKIIGPSGLNATTNASGILISNHLPVGEYRIRIYSSSENASMEHMQTDVLVFPFNLASYEFIVDTSTTPVSLEKTNTSLTWCSGILIILSIIVLIGVISSWRRQYSDVALVGALVGIFTLGFYLLGVLLSIIALILIYKSKEEFEDGKKGKSF